MAKPTYAKLKLSVNTDVKILNWEDQAIEIKQYLPVQEKLELVSRVINLASDENKFYSLGKIDVFFALEVIYAYTNITFTEKQKEDFVKLFDSMQSSGFYNLVVNEIPPVEIDYLYDLVTDAAKQIYTYQNSVYGILDAISTDYNNLDLDIKKLTDQIGNRENAEFLDEVLTKMG